MLPPLALPSGSEDARAHDGFRRRVLLNVFARRLRLPQQGSSVIEMQVCAGCGKESEEGFAFCPHCGVRLTAERIQRKIVTVLFCDVVGSTASGESVDAETARSLLAHFFVRMKGIIEAHGGVVDKFIGDAVMAVFGVPVAHEDDALRAVRAASEMRAALPELKLLARIGINTGEVVTGTAERLVTGDAVNVAARLEQVAAPGTVLLGAGTVQLVQGKVDVSPVGSLELKGKSEPVPAWELLSLRRAPAEHRPPTPMIGRKAELEQLRAVLDQALRARSCRLFTILGDAGVGKSRLASEFLAGLEARVVRGRCLSYGKGITYWPIVEVVKQLDALPKNEAAAAAIRSLLGKIESGTSGKEIAWAFRELLEQEAQDAPLVCVLDDLHWGEETFLNLVEEVAALARDAPILLLCMARPDLLEHRSALGDGNPNATATLIEPLDEEESVCLLEELGGVSGDADAADVEAGARHRELRERICAAADGNPLFIEELHALVQESRVGELAMPPTIQALLAARLDQLDPTERGVLERGAVAGRVFHQSAVEYLVDEEPNLHVVPGCARAQGVDSASRSADSRRQRLPLPPPADPGRHLRRTPENGPGRATRALRRLARRVPSTHDRSRRASQLPP